MSARFPDRITPIGHVGGSAAFRQALAMFALAGVAIVGSAAVSLWFAEQILRAGH